MTLENRDAFFTRLEPYFAPSKLLDIELAYTLAKFGHRAQLRNEIDSAGNPVRYFEHVRRVALLLIDEAKIVDREMTIAALLHDGIEDTRDLTPAMIEHCFGHDVTMIVKTLSKVPKEGYIDRFKACVDWRPYAIKACDRIDNLRSLSGSTADFVRKQISETEETYYPLFDRMVTLAPSAFHVHVQSLRDEVRRLTTHARARMELV